MELASLYTVPLSAVDGLSRLTKLTTSKAAGTADSIRKFSNRPITFESNLEAPEVPTKIVTVGWLVGWLVGWFVRSCRLL